MQTKTWLSGKENKQAAPFRMITVKDAISDLPVIGHNLSPAAVPYGSKPLSAYQEHMRNQQEVVKDQCVRPLSELVRYR